MGKEARRNKPRRRGRPKVKDPFGSCSVGFNHFLLLGLVWFARFQLEKNGLWFVIAWSTFFTSSEHGWSGKSETVSRHRVLVVISLRVNCVRVRLACVVTAQIPFPIFPFERLSRRLVCDDRDCDYSVLSVTTIFQRKTDDTESFYWNNLKPVFG